MEIGAGSGRKHTRTGDTKCFKNRDSRGKNQRVLRQPRPQISRYALSGRGPRCPGGVRGAPPDTCPGGPPDVLGGAPRTPRTRPGQSRTPPGQTRTPPDTPRTNQTPRTPPGQSRPSPDTPVQSQVIRGLFCVLDVGFGSGFRVFLPLPPYSCLTAGKSAFPGRLGRPGQWPPERRPRAPKGQGRQV